MVSNLQLVCGTVWRHWIWEGWVVVCKAVSVDTGLWVGGKKSELGYYDVQNHHPNSVLPCSRANHVFCCRSPQLLVSCGFPVSFFQALIFWSPVYLVRLVSFAVPLLPLLCQDLLTSPTPPCKIRIARLFKFHPKMRQRLNSWQIWHSIVSLKSDTINLVYLWYSTELSLLCLWLPIKANMWHSRKCFF